jgi:hypothetical protein
LREAKKQLKKNYQGSTRPMGVFLIRNNLNDKLFLGAGLDLHGIINRHKFQLKNGTHPNKQLQTDWNQLGSDNFAFEIVDELKPREGVEFDYRQELDFLETLWLEKLQPFGDRGYNVPKLSRAEMLRRISTRSLNREP